MSKVAIQGNASGTGVFTIASPNSNTDRTLTLPDEAGTVVVTGTTPALNGVTFPASQVTSADANTLDDYEEGTWTPVVSSGTATIKDVSGTYTKIGNRVIASFGFSGNATGTINIIGGLPFTSNQSTNGAAREIQNTGFLWCAQVVSSSTTFGFRRYDNNSTLTANDVYVGMIVYQV